MQLFTLLCAAQGAGEWPSELQSLGFNSSAAAPTLEALVLAATQRGATQRLPKAFRDNPAVRAFAGAAARSLSPGLIGDEQLRAATVRLCSTFLSQTG